MPIEKYPINDQKTLEMLHRGDNLGITYAESRGMRKIFIQLKPKTTDLFGKTAIQVHSLVNRKMNVRQ